MTRSKVAGRAAGTTHFPAHAWVDYIRGLGSEDVRETMTQHLESGCSRCHLTVQLFRRIADVTRADEDFKETDEMLREALAVFERKQRV